MLLEGKQIKAKETVGWLTDYSGNLEDCLRKAWQVMEKGTEVLPLRMVEEKSLGNISFEEKIFTNANGMAESVRAIAKCIEESCRATLSDAVTVQAKLSADFMLSKSCRKGKVGIEYDKVMSN